MQTVGPPELKAVMSFSSDSVLKAQMFPLQQEDPSRKRKLQERREGSTQALNWNKTRPCRRNKKRASAQASRYVFLQPLPSSVDVH